MRPRQGQKCVDLIQEGPHFRMVQSGPDDNVPKRMTHKTAETKRKEVFTKRTVNITTQNGSGTDYL